MEEKITLTINPTITAKCCWNIYSSVYTCPKIASESRAVVAHTFNPSTQRQRQAHF